jgi:hypothetical protein
LRCEEDQLTSESGKADWNTSQSAFFMGVFVARTFLFNHVEYRGSISEKKGTVVDEALKYAQRAKELAPENAEVDDTLGWSYLQAGALCNGIAV